MEEVFPAAPNERAIIVDVVRGFALVGVLFANFTSYVDQQTPKPILNSISSSLDNALMDVNSVFIEWKFITLFSILFGYGFGLILESLENKRINPNWFFVKRMFWLFVLGFIHTLFWSADILNLYAMSGIFLLLFRKSSTKMILIFSILFMFILSALISYGIRNFPPAFTDQAIQDMYEAYKNGNIADVFIFNIDLYYRMFIVSGINLHDIIQTLGKFLFGYFLLRIQFFQAVETRKSIFKKVALWTAPFTMMYFVFEWITIKQNFRINQYLGEAVESIGILATTSFYVCILVLAYISYGKSALFFALQSLGRTTLTNYLLISAFLIVLLYGIGFNQLGVISISTIWILAFVWLMVEILFSLFWLRKYRYGPVEWIWRQLTYGKRLALRREVKTL